MSSAEYNRMYRVINKEEVNRRRREQYKNSTPEHKKARLEYLKAWQKRNRDKVNAAKRRCENTERGKILKKMRELRYKLSGKRTLAERRRRVLSPKRYISHRLYQIKRRAGERELSELDLFVLSEAVDLTRLRNVVTGIKWHVDHIVPVSKGGTSEYTNIQVVPALWNWRKSNHSAAKFWR